MDLSRRRVGDHQLQLATRRPRQLVASLHSDLRLVDPEFRKPQRDRIAQPRLELAARPEAWHDQDAHARSLLEDLELAHLAVARHDPELDGMHHNLAVLLARKPDHFVGATLDRARANLQGAG